MREITPEFLAELDALGEAWCNSRTEWAHIRYARAALGLEADHE